MGMYDSGDNFQAKVDELLSIDQMIIIFGRLREVGLKVNAPRCSFGLKEITYLGCVI